MPRPTRFEYRERDPKEATARANRSGGGFDTVIKDRFEQFKAKEGDHLIRFLPPTWDNAEHYGLDIHVHNNVGPDNQAYLCLTKMKGEPCPVCEARAATTDDEESKALKPGTRVAAWIIDRDNEKAGPIIWTMPFSKVDKVITTLGINKRTGAVLPLDHPDEGYDIEFKRTGQRLNTEYIGIAVARASTPLSDDPKQAEAWLQFITDNPIPDVLNYYDYDHIDRVLNGKAKEEPATDEQPVRRAAARAEEEQDLPPRQRTARGQEDTQAEEDPPFDPDTGEVEKPAAARSRPTQRDRGEEASAPRARPRPQQPAAKPAEDAEEESPARERLKRLSERGRK